MDSAIWISDEGAHQPSSQSRRMRLGQENTQEGVDQKYRPTIPKGALEDITNRENNRETLKVANIPSQKGPSMTAWERKLISQQQSSQASQPSEREQYQDPHNSIEMMNSELKRLLNEDNLQQQEYKDERISNHDHTFQDLCYRINVLTEDSTQRAESKVEMGMIHGTTEEEDQLLKYFRKPELDSSHQGSIARTESIGRKPSSVDYRNPSPTEKRGNTMDEDQFQKFLGQIDKALAVEEVDVLPNAAESRWHPDTHNSNNKKSEQSKKPTQKGKTLVIEDLKNNHYPNGDQNRSILVQKPPLPKVDPKGGGYNQVVHPSESNNQKIRSDSVKVQKEAQENQKIISKPQKDAQITSMGVKKPQLRPEESFTKLKDGESNVKQIASHNKLQTPKPSTHQTPILTPVASPQVSKSVHIREEVMLKELESHLQTIPRETAQEVPKSILKSQQYTMDISEKKHLSREQQEELDGHLTDLKLTELKGKLTFLLHKKPKDCAVFIRLIRETLGTFTEDKSYQMCLQKHMEVCGKVNSLMNKVKELSKILKMGELQSDQQFQKLMVDNLVGNVSELIRLLSQYSSGWSSVKASDVKLRTPDYSTIVTKRAEPDHRDDELDIYVKRSEEAIKTRPESLSAKIDFNRIERKMVHMEEQYRQSEKRNLLDADSRKIAADKFEKKPSVSQFDHYPPRAVIQGHGQEYKLNQVRSQFRHDQQYQSGPIQGESQMTISQKFGCRIYCIKLIQKFLVCGFEDGGLSVFSINKKEGLNLERSNKLHAKPISSITCTASDQKRQLLFTGYAGTLEASIIVWDFSSLKPLKELCGHTATISCLEYMVPNYLVSASFDRKVIFWDLNECEAVLSTEVHNGPILSSYYDSETKCLYTGSLDSTIIISGLIFEEGELLDCKILKQISGSGPILHLTSYLGDKLISFQNSKIVLYDSRGLLFREIKTNTLPNSVEILTEDRGIFVDVNGKPHGLNIGELLDNRNTLEFPIPDLCSMEKSSVMMGLRLNGAHCQAQILQDSSGMLVISANEKTDTLLFHIIR